MQPYVMLQPGCSCVVRCLTHLPEQARCNQTAASALEQKGRACNVRIIFITKLPAQQRLCLGVLCQGLELMPGPSLLQLLASLCQIMCEALELPANQTRELMVQSPGSPQSCQALKGASRASVASCHLE